MNLNAIRDTITSSSPAGWHRIGDGPYFHNRPYHGEDDYDSRHGERAVLIDDVNVSLEWGMSTNGHQDERGHLWARERQFPDPAVYSFWIDVFYAGSLVDRVLAYSVDGGRAYLPRYDQRRTENGDQDAAGTGAWEFPVDEWPYELTKLISGLNGMREFHEYFERAGFIRR